MNEEQITKHFASCSTKELLGHKKIVQSVAWNCTGQKLASGSVDNTTRVWSLTQDGRNTQEMELKGHSDGVANCCWSPISADLLATCSSDKSVKLWDARNGKNPHTFKTTGQLLNLAWSPNGQYLAAGSKKDMITFYDLRVNKLFKTLQMAVEINEMAFDKSSEHFLITTQDGIVKICSFPDIQEEYELTATGGQCFCIEFDSTGKYFATGGADALVGLWDVSELVCIRTFSRLDSSIRTLSFSYDGQYIAYASEDPIVDISNVETGKSVKTIQLKGEKVSLTSVSWNPKHHLLAIGGQEEDKTNRYSGLIGTVYVFGFPPT